MVTHYQAVDQPKCLFREGASPGGKYQISRGHDGHDQDDNASEWSQETRS
jgi:hypothetical protein